MAVDDTSGTTEPAPTFAALMDVAESANKRADAATQQRWKAEEALRVESAKYRALRAAAEEVLEGAAGPMERLVEPLQKLREVLAVQDDSPESVGDVEA